MFIKCVCVCVCVFLCVCVCVWPNNSNWKTFFNEDYLEPPVSSRIKKDSYIRQYLYV